MTKAAPKSLGLGQGLPSSLPQAPRARETSGAAYTMFSAQQVKQFKEAFNMMDQDGDGRISEADLRTMLTELGQTAKPDLLNALLTARPGRATGSADGINFTQFLAMMGERLLHLDREHDLLEAFACFDEGDKGWVKVAEVRKFLAEMGDRMSQEEIERLFNGPFTDRQGRFNYIEWAKVLRVNDAGEARPVTAAA
ncbi:hypothetical protein CspeluHIS016_0101880 [Cutaneotrichosporon spelunceum]|uniref:EF-hand domain-containing protein n=1 Tax=Cutaneotrichosporon spelunceum TaxID=1672016 RepID=A0AAD3Y9A5_9TREE|nr:hypothetical protein CspeluHIS016_0101880 [Cutaneotrichosporon spelunceum]